MTDHDRLSKRREARRAGTMTRGRPMKPLENHLTPFEVLAEDGVEAIHRASMRLLRDPGMLIVDFPPARETFREHGAIVEGENVRIDEETLLHFVRQAPSTFTQLARNPSNNAPIGGRHMLFAPVYGPPFVGDLDRGRQRATLEDYARARQAVMVTPFLIAGAMSPTTMAATIAQQNAEALFGIAYAQMLNPGTPCIYGSFLANIDMKSGAPCFGTPEDALALYA